MGPSAVVMELGMFMKRLCSYKNTLYVIFFTVLIFFSAVTFAYQNIELTSEVDKNEVNVGDRIKLKISADDIKGLELKFSQKPEEIGEFSFLSSKQIKPNIQEYIISTFKTGTQVIPPIKVEYRLSSETEWQNIESPQVPIEVVSLLNDQEKDIRALKSIILFPSKLPLLIAFLLIATMVGLFIYLGKLKKNRKKERTQADKFKTAYDVAYEELKRLQNMDLPKQGRIKEYYIILSDIARHYLENRFDLRAPEMTTEEFLEAVRKSPKLKDEHKKLLKEFLSHCDMVKFAKYGPTPLEILDSYKSAEALVDQTKIEEEAEKEMVV